MLRTLVVRMLLVLVALLVANSALVGGYLLAGLSQDAIAQKVFWWLLMAVLLLTAANIVLLVGALALIQVGGSETRDESEEQPGLLGTS